MTFGVTQRRDALLSWAVVWEIGDVHLISTLSLDAMTYRDETHLIRLWMHSLSMGIDCVLLPHFLSHFVLIVPAAIPSCLRSHPVSSRLARVVVRQYLFADVGIDVYFKLE